MVASLHGPIRAYSGTSPGSRRIRWSWIAVPVLAAMLLGFGQVAAAQGSFSLTTGLTPNNNNYGYIYEVQAITPIVIYRIGCIIGYGSAGTYNIDLWKRPGGHNGGIPDPSWVQVGAQPVTFTAAITQIPIDINHTLAPGEKLGFCIISNSPVGYVTGSVADVSDANLTIHVTGYGKGTSPGATPPVATSSNYPRSCVGTVWYDPAGVDIASPTPGPLPDATEGQTGYNETFECSGGFAPFTWSLTGGAPGWLEFNPTTGTQVQLTSPTIGPAGTYTFDVSVDDNNGNNATETYTLLVNPPPVITGPATLDDLTEGGDWFFPPVFQPTGGTAPFIWTMTGAPPGVTLDVNGVMHGPPDPGTAAGSPYDVTILLEDANGVVDQVGPLSINVNLPPTITTTTLADAAVGFAYSDTVMAANGSLPFTWSIAGNSGPFSIDSATGEITGMPVNIGLLTFDVTVMDNCGLTDTATLSILIQDPPIINQIVLPPLTEGVALSPSIDFTADGGMASSYSWTSPTSIPSGMTLVQVGVAGEQVFRFSGTPDIGSAGDYPMSIQVEDTSTGLTDSFSVTLSVNAPPQIDTTAVPPTLPMATETGAYSVTFQAVSGTGTAPLTWALGTVAGPDVALPGFTLTDDTLSASAVGNPLGDYFLDVMLTDANGSSTVITYSLTIRPVVELDVLADAIVGEPYEATIQVVPDTGVGPFVFTISTDLDALIGLTVDVSGPSPVISGTPVVGSEGPKNLVLNVEDSNQVSQLITLVLTILPPNALDSNGGCCGATPGTGSATGWLLLVLLLALLPPLRLAHRRA